MNRRTFVQRMMAGTVALGLNEKAALAVTPPVTEVIRVGGLQGLQGPLIGGRSTPALSAITGPSTD